MASTRFTRRNRTAVAAVALVLMGTVLRERPEQANSDLLVDEIVRLIVPFLRG